MNKKPKKGYILKILRVQLQIVFLIFLPALYIGTLSGIQQIYQAVIHQSFSAALLPRLIEVLAIIPVTILLGRFFCGWMCAFGSYGDFIYFISRKIFKKKLQMDEQADKWMKYIKYVVLAVLVVAVWSFGSTMFSTASPWDAFGMLVSVWKWPDFSYVILNFTVGFLILIGITIASALVERAFCRYLCPMGAIFAIASKLRIAKIKKPAAKCGKCRICTDHCAMGIPLYKMDSVSSGECIDCMKCVTVCPRSNTSFTIAQKDVRPLMAGVATAAIITGMYYVGDFTLGTGGLDIVAAIEVSGQAGTVNQVYNDGTYQGSGIGFRGGMTTLSVTVKNDKIVSISTVSYQDDTRYYKNAYTAVTNEIISSQSAEADAVSGATFSSNGIMEAVANALEKAQINTSSLASVQSSSASSSSGASSFASPSSETSSAVASGTTSPASSSSSSQTASTVSGTYKDGTYQGSGTGFRGTTSVSVVVSGGKITNITVNSYQDDRKYFQRAFSAIYNEIISSQSAKVNAVSGATFSSNGIMKAVANALSKAK